MKVFLFVIITYLSGNGTVQTQLIPVDSMAHCEAAGQKIVESNKRLLPTIITTYSCIIQGN